MTTVNRFYVWYCEQCLPTWRLRMPRFENRTLAHAFKHSFSMCTPYFFTIKSECLNWIKSKTNHWKIVLNLRLCCHRLIRWFEDYYLLVFWFISVKFKTHGSRKLILSFSWNNFQISRFDWWIELYQAAIAKQQF